MHRILTKREIGPNCFEMTVEASEIAPKVRAGMFLIIRIDEHGERIPLTFVNWDAKQGTITICFLAIGKTTKHLASLEPGDYIRDIAGPLGNPTHTENYGHVVCIAGGVGAAEMRPVAQAFKEGGNRVTVIEGARTAGLLIYEEELAEAADELKIATDDGSKGYHGFGIGLLKEMLEAGEKIDLIYTVGPGVMMKAIADATRPFGVLTLASVNPIMIDGTGMCGGCRVEVDGKTRYGCVEGPEFDAHKINWDVLLSRQRTYVDEEKLSLDRFLSVKEAAKEEAPVAR